MKSVLVLNEQCRRYARVAEMKKFGTKINKLGKESASDEVRVNGSKRVGQSNSCSFLNVINVHSMISMFIL